MVVTSGGCLVYLDLFMSIRQTRQVTTFMQVATRNLHIIVETAKIYGLWAKWFTSVRWLIRLKRFECYIKLKLCYFTDFIYPSAFKLVESCRRHANCKAYPIVCWVPKLLCRMCCSVLQSTIIQDSGWYTSNQSQPLRANLGTQLIPITADEHS